MNWDEWLDTKTMKALLRHGSANLTAIAIFALIAFVLKLVPLPDSVRFILEGIDHIVLIGLFGWLAYQMALVLWKGRVRNDLRSFVMVA